MTLPGDGKENQFDCVWTKRYTIWNVELYVEILE